MTARPRRRASPSQTDTTATSPSPTIAWSRRHASASGEVAPQSGDDYERLDAAPADAGSYAVVASATETSHYAGGIASRAFSIAPVPSSPQVSVASRVYDGTPLFGRRHDRCRLRRRGHPCVLSGRRGWGDERRHPAVRRSHERRLLLRRRNGTLDGQLRGGAGGPGVLDREGHARTPRRLCCPTWRCATASRWATSRFPAAGRGRTPRRRSRRGWRAPWRSTRRRTRPTTSPWRGRSRSGWSPAARTRRGARTRRTRRRARRARLAPTLRACPPRAIPRPLPGLVGLLALAGAACLRAGSKGRG
jgi:hypothetical protein